MIVDTSALIAIFKDEPEAGDALNFLENADNLKISNGTMFECVIVLQSQLGAAGVQKLHAALSVGDIQQVPVNDEQVRIIEKGFVRYGKGQGGKAGLNFGDCFAYALAKETGETLLCKGNDFIHTDIEVIRLDSGGQ